VTQGLCQTPGLAHVHQETLRTVEDYVERQIVPVAQEFEHADKYQEDIVDGLGELGMFGTMIPEASHANRRRHVRYSEVDHWPRPAEGLFVMGSLLVSQVLEGQRGACYLGAKACIGNGLGYREVSDGA
jgi:alkylation response protein AidB-like acyl-CoA dehydrogenase